MEEKETRKSTVNLLAVLVAFIMGLTAGNIDFDALRDGSLTTTAAASLINRENVSKKKATTDSVKKTTALLAQQTEAETEATEGDFFTMYRTPTGKKYHFDPGCAGENRIVTNLDEATSLGLTPCKRCADG